MRSFRFVPLALVGAWLASGACAPLEEIEPNVCGNRAVDCVVREGDLPTGVTGCETVDADDEDRDDPYAEDCDSYGAGDGTSCIEPGVPGECHFSCAASGPAETTGDAPSYFHCPTGMGLGCGSDGVCRRPRTLLGEPVNLGVVPGRWLGAADFDGDGNDDVATVSSSALAIHYMADGRVESSYASSFASEGPPAIGQLNETEAIAASAQALSVPRPLRARQGLADLVLPTDEGLLVLRGSEQRALLNNIYFIVEVGADDTVELVLGSADLLEDVTVYTDPTAESGEDVALFPGSEALMLTPRFHPDQPGPNASISIVQERNPLCIAPSPAAPSLARTLTGAQLDESTPTDELVVAYEGLSRVLVARVFDPHRDLDFVNARSGIRPEVQLVGCELDEVHCCKPVVGGEGVTCEPVAPEPGECGVSLEGNDALTVGSGALLVHLNPPLPALNENEDGGGGGGGGGGGSAGCNPWPAMPRDGHLDLLIHGGDGDNAGLFVAYGTGNGSFHSDVTDADGADGDMVAQRIPAFESCPVLPVAAGDLDGDGEIDLAMPAFTREGEEEVPAGIWASRALAQIATTDGCEKVTYCTREKPPVAVEGRTWVEGQMADFNGDGRLDLVAAPEVAGGLDYFGGTGTSLLVDASVITPFLARDLAVGDYDGNGIADLAFVEKFAAGSGDSLSMLFGLPFTVPSVPTSLGLLPVIDEVATTDFPGIDGSFDVDALSDVFIGGRGTDLAGNKTLGFAASFGSATRQLGSPFVLRPAHTQAVPSPYRPLAVVIDRFGFLDGTGELPAMMAVGAGSALKSKGRAYPFALAADGDANLEVLQPVLEFFTVDPKEPEPPASPELHTGVGLHALAGAAAFAAPVDGVQAPVAVSLIGVQERDEITLAVLQLPDPAMPIDALTETLDGLRITGAAGDQDVDDACGLPIHHEGVHNELTTCRFDADGRESLLVQLIDSRGNGTQNRAFVFTASGLQGFLDQGSLSDEAYFAVEPATSELDASELVGATCMNLDGDDADELVLAVLRGDCDSLPSSRVSLELIHFGGTPAPAADGSAFPSRVLGSLGAGELGLSTQTVVLPVGILPGDFNGDGLRDLVLAGPSSMFLLRGVAFVP